MPIALTIAGSDPSGGAGVQADLKTFHQHGVYGTSVLALLTVQNTKGVSHVELMPPEVVRAQLRAVLEDVPPAAAKTGALGDADIIEAVRMLWPKAIPLVVDPVMISKHGAKLLDAAAIDAMRGLLKRATLVTPNAHEAGKLVGRPVRTAADAKDAARTIAATGPAALVKGGHLEEEDAVDVLCVGDQVDELRAPRVDTDQTHGTGCALSASIAARLARGATLEDAVRGAKAWLAEALRRAPGIGGGVGPPDHFTPVTDL